MFVSDVDEDLLCGICHEVMVEPRCCQQGHSFCRACELPVPVPVLVPVLVPACFDCLSAIRARQTHACAGDETRVRAPVVLGARCLSLQVLKRLPVLGRWRSPPAHRGWHRVPASLMLPLLHCVCGGLAPHHQASLNGSASAARRAPSTGRS